jgi:hypothetical protein
MLMGKDMHVNSETLNSNPEAMATPPFLVEIQTIIY